MMNWAFQNGLLLPEWRPQRKRRPDRNRHYIFTPGGGPHPGCHCAVESCTIYADDFSGDLSGFSQEAGSWSIVSGEASVASSNALLICNTEYPAEGFHKHVILAKLLASAGNRSRVIFSYDSEAGTFNYFEVFWNGSSSEISLGTSAGGAVRTVTFDPADYGGLLDDYWAGSICIFDDGAEVYGDGPYLSAGIDSTATACGLGTGTVASGTVTFDDFELSYHGDDGPGECPTCACSACTTWTPPRFYLPVRSLTGTICSTMNDDYYLYRGVGGYLVGGSAEVSCWFGGVGESGNTYAELDLNTRVAGIWCAGGGIGTQDITFDIPEFGDCKDIDELALTFVRFEYPSGPWVGEICLNEEFSADPTAALTALWN